MPVSLVLDRFRERKKIMTKNEIYDLEVDNFIKEMKKLIVDRGEVLGCSQRIPINGDFNREVMLDYDAKEKKLKVEFNSTGKEEKELRDKLEQNFFKVKVLFLGMDITNTCNSLVHAREAKTEEECGRHLKDAHKSLINNLFKTFDSKASV